MNEGSLIAGKYRLVSLLGRGGMGSVWRAQHLDLDAPVAIKLLDPSIAANPEGLTRFHREAQAAAALRSPHVVQIFDRGIDDATQQPFIVMELMEGESLADRIGRLGLLSPEQTARIVTQVARALGRAHDAGIVHRDLKPDNIFLVRNEDEEVAKVLDFGIAKSDKHRLDSGSHTRTGAVMGTPYYMSPEQISGSKGVDARTDIWALGVIACECLTGRRPFDAETIGGLALKICAEPPPIPSRLGPVSPAFDAWFARSVARETTARFQTAREAADELRRAFGMATAVATNATGQHAAVPAKQANTTSGLARSSADAVTAEMAAKAPFPRWALAGGLAAFATVAGGAAWFFLGRTPAATPDATSSALSAPAAPSAASIETAPDAPKPPVVAPSATATPEAPATPSAAPAPSATPAVARPAVAARPAPAPKRPPTPPKSTGGKPASDLGSAIDQRR
ncbi:MAG TPA: serine/threonine-protein kinase [Polyangiaceae bacterium]